MADDSIRALERDIAAASDDNSACVRLIAALARAGRFSDITSALQGASPAVYRDVLPTLERLRNDPSIHPHWLRALYHAGRNPLDAALQSDAPIDVTLLNLAIYAQANQALRQAAAPQLAHGQTPVHPYIVLPNENGGFELHPRPFTLDDLLRIRTRIAYQRAHELAGNEWNKMDAPARQAFAIANIVAATDHPLWNNYNDTSTAIVYEGGTNRCALIPLSVELCTLAPDFREECLSLESLGYGSNNRKAYENFLAGLRAQGRPFTELLADNPQCNRALAEGEVASNPAWSGSTGKATRMSYAPIEFAYIHTQFGSDECMGFYPLQGATKSHLRAVCVGRRGLQSDAYGLGGLGNACARLAVVAQRQSETLR